MDLEFYKLNEKFQEMQGKLEEDHNKQISELKESYENKYANKVTFGDRNISCNPAWQDYSTCSTGRTKARRPSIGFSSSILRRRSKMRGTRSSSHMVMMAEFMPGHAWLP